MNRGRAIFASVFGSLVIALTITGCLEDKPTDLFCNPCSWRLIFDDGKEVPLKNGLLKQDFLQDSKGNYCIKKGTSFSVIIKDGESVTGKRPVKLIAHRNSVGVYGGGFSVDDEFVICNEVTVKIE